MTYLDDQAIIIEVWNIQEAMCKLAGVSEYQQGIEELGDIAQQVFWDRPFKSVA